MTEVQYNIANKIKAEIASIDALLPILECADNFSFDPPTRLSGIALETLHGDHAWRQLTEGEVACIKKALEDKKMLLQQEFEKL